jgi:hypothetical protein
MDAFEAGSDAESLDAGKIGFDLRHDEKARSEKRAKVFLLITISALC